MQPSHSNPNSQQTGELVRSRCDTPWKCSASKEKPTKSLDKATHTAESKKKRPRIVIRTPKLAISNPEKTEEVRDEKKLLIEELSKALRRVQIERWKGDRDLLCRVKDLEKQLKSIQASLLELSEEQKQNLSNELNRKKGLGCSIRAQPPEGVGELKAQIESLKKENAEFRERIWKLESKLSDLVKRDSIPKLQRFPGRTSNFFPYGQSGGYCSNDWDSLDSTTRSDQNLEGAEKLEMIKSEYFSKMAIVINKTEELLTEFLFPGESLMILSKIISTIDEFFAGRYQVSNCEEFRQKAELLDLSSSFKRFELRRLDFTPKEENVRLCAAISKDELSWAYLHDLAEAFGTTKEISSLRSLVFRLLPIPDDLFDKGRWHLQL